MYDLYQKSLKYDRRRVEYKTFLEHKCKHLGIMNNYSPNIIKINPILTYDRTINDYYKIHLYLSRLLVNDCINIVMKYIINMKEPTTLDWYKDLYDILRCRGINKMFNDRYKTDNPKPDLNIPWPYYICDTISYMNCTILNKINNKKMIKYKYGWGPKKKNYDYI